MGHMIMLLITALVQSAMSSKINFVDCQSLDWHCVNNLPSEIVYTCSNDGNKDLILKDFYTGDIKSVTVQNCRDLHVILDCPILEKQSQLQTFKIKNCEKLEFVSLSSNSLLQTPSEIIIENVDEVISLPRGIFKSPSSPTESKCLGTSALKKIFIVNTKINTINKRALYNVTGIKQIEFNNVTITNVQNQAIEAIMGCDSEFTFTNSRIYNLKSKGIVVKSTLAFLTQNTFNDIITDSINITASNILIIDNAFKAINPYGLALKSSNMSISLNNFTLLKTNAFKNVKCSRKVSDKGELSFFRNNIETVEPHSLTFHYNSCESAETVVNFTENKMDCKCRNIEYLNTPTSNLHNIILDPQNNNTCLSVPCILPVDIVKIIMKDNMCNLDLSPKIMCLWYHDKHTTPTIEDDEVTESLPPPTFYMIRSATIPNGEASAALTAIDKDTLLKSGKWTLRNRTVKVVFDSIDDFVETLRGTDNSRTKATVPTTTEFVNRCVTSPCNKNIVRDKERALEFYKSVYAQLRPPRVNTTRKVTTNRDKIP